MSGTSGRSTGPPLTELDALLAFVANAIARHARDRARNGSSVPPLAVELARWLAAAPSGTERQPVDCRCADGDAGQMNAPLMLTIDQAAQLLSLSPRTVRSMVKDGRLPAVRIGRAVRIRRGDVERLVALHAGQPASPRFHSAVTVKDHSA